MQALTMEAQQKAHHAPTDALPPGWSRNNAGELCDAEGLTVLDWWKDADLETACDFERSIIQKERQLRKEERKCNIFAKTKGIKP